jgi:hypothetical protein
MESVLGSRVEIDQLTFGDAVPARFIDPHGDHS